MFVRASVSACSGHVPLVDAHSLIYDWLNAAACVAVNYWQAIKKGRTNCSWRNVLQAEARAHAREAPCFHAFALTGTETDGQRDKRKLLDTPTSPLLGSQEEN